MCSRARPVLFLLRAALAYAPALRFALALSYYRRLVRWWFDRSYRQGSSSNYGDVPDLVDEGYGEWNWEWWNDNYDDADAGTDAAFDRMAGDFNDEMYNLRNRSSLGCLQGIPLLNGFLGITSIMGLQMWPWKHIPEMQDYQKKVLVVCVMGSGTTSAWIRQWSEIISGRGELGVGFLRVP